MQDFKAFANRLADEAGQIVRKHFRQPFDVTSKEDASPVTIADRSVEQRLRELIEAERPEDGILGEEFGSKETASGYTWVLDPIDGTKSFVIGRPTFGTLIALCKDGVPVLGVIDQPVMRERWVGVTGERTTFNHEPVRTRSCDNLEHAISACTAPGMFRGKNPGFIETWIQACRFVVWGGDCTSFGHLASGRIDLIIEACLQPYDYLALTPVIEGAGGRITNWQGQGLTMDSDGHVVAVGDERLLPSALAFLKKEASPIAP